jgi:hypothetical protein
MTKKTTTPAFIQKLERMEEYGMAITKNWISMWQESLRYFFSDQLHGKKQHKDWDWVILNYMWSSAIQEIAKLSRNHAKIITNPWSEDDADSAEVWQSILQWLWEKGLNKCGMRLEQIYAIMDGKIFGYRISKIFWENKCYWDEKAQQWVGDVKHRLWHPAEFWASETEKIDDGACGTVRYVDLEYAQNRWSDYKAQLDDRASSFKDAQAAGGNYIRGQTAAQSTYPSLGKGGKDSGPDAADPSILLTRILEADKMSDRKLSTEDDRRYVKISECYFKDFDEEEIEQEEDINELIQSGVVISDNGSFIDKRTGDLYEPRIARKYKRPKYPRGRHIIRCEDIILNPYDQNYPYQRWPFIVVPHYLLPHMWQGTDAVQMYKTEQDMINVTVSHLVNNMKQFGDPRVAVESGAVQMDGRTKKAKKIFSGAGTIIKLMKGAIRGQRYKIEHPIPPSQSVTQLYQIFSQEFKNRVGLQNISQGIKEKGEMSASESVRLAMTSDDRIQLQSVFEDEWVRQNAGLMAEVVQAKYDIGRIVRVVGQDRIVGAQQITQGLKELRFDVDIEPGTMLPFDEEKRIAKYVQAYQMLQDPTPNPMLPEMLRVLEIPNWRKVLAKHESYQLFMQFAGLLEQVQKNEITPEQAIQILTNAAIQRFQQQQQSPQGIAARNVEKGDFDNKQLKIDRQQGKLDVKEAIFDLEVKAEKERENAVRKEKETKKKT